MQNYEAEDKRVFARFPVKLSLKFLDLFLNKEGTGKTNDISAKGISFVANEELRPMTPVELWLSVAERPEPFYTRGEVVWSEPQRGGKCRVGISLDKAELMGFSRLIRR